MVRRMSGVLAICCVALCAALPAIAEDTGATIYKAQCTMCHGDDGTSNTPVGQALKAASFKDPAIIKISDADRMVVVKKGKNGMPAFAGKLTDAQIKSVLAYVRTLEK